MRTRVQVIVEADDDTPAAVPGGGPSVQGSKPRVLVAEPSRGGGARNELPPRSALGPANLTRVAARTQGISRARQIDEGHRRSPTGRGLHGASSRQPYRRGTRWPQRSAESRRLDAWALVAARALEQAEVEDGLYAAAERNGLVGDDGPRQTWATIRSGLGAGLSQPIDLDSSRP
jgi:hypothetical protein